MPKKVIKDMAIGTAKKQLGEEIAKCRGTDRSQRSLASAVGLPPSNMKYIEDGVNAPSAECYLKLISILKPSLIEQKKMDSLYALIRKVPPPDVCKIINSNQGLFDAIRLLNGITLTAEQLKMIKDLFISFGKESNKGEYENDR